MIMPERAKLNVTAHHDGLVRLAIGPWAPTPLTAADVRWLIRALNQAAKEARALAATSHATPEQGEDGMD